MNWDLLFMTGLMMIIKGIIFQGVKKCRVKFSRNDLIVSCLY